MSVPTISDLVAGGRIAAGLIRLVYRPCTPERVRTLILGRIARRNDLFLEMVWKTIWRQPTSPYRRLLTWAGWTFDTLRDSVHQRGLDDTLKALRDAGVYLTYQEFKGRRPIQRDGLTIECTERAFDNPAVLPTFMESTGGLWRQADTIQVIRQEPVPTSSGKLLPFHTQALAAFRPGGTGGGELPAERNALKK